MMDGMNSSQNVHIHKVSQHSSKWSLTYLIILLPAISYLSPRTSSQIAITQSKMIAIAYEGSVYHSSLYGGWDGLTSKCTYPHGKSIIK
jgi:hypothetical protein